MLTGGVVRIWARNFQGVDKMVILLGVCDVC